MICQGNSPDEAGLPPTIRQSGSTPLLWDRPQLAVKFSPKTALKQIKDRKLIVANILV